MEELSIVVRGSGSKVGLPVRLTSKNAEISKKFRRVCRLGYDVELMSTPPPGNQIPESTWDAQVLGDTKTILYFIHTTAKGEISYNKKRPCCLDQYPHYRPRFPTAHVRTGLQFDTFENLKENKRTQAIFF